MQPVNWVGFKASDPLLGHLHLCGMMFLHTIHTYTHTPKTVKLSERRFFFLSSPVQHHSWSMLGSIMLGGCFIEAGAGDQSGLRGKLKGTNYPEHSGPQSAPKVHLPTRGVSSSLPCSECLVCIVTLMTVWALLYSRDEQLWF